MRHKRVKHTVLGRNPEEAAVPIEVAHKVAAEAVRVVHSTEEVAVPIAVVHKAIEVADRVVAVARKAAAVAETALAAAADLDHKTC